MRIKEITVQGDTKSSNLFRDSFGTFRDKANIIM